MPKHSLKLLAKKPPKMLLNSLITMIGMSLEVVVFIEANSLIAMDVCSL